MKYAFFLILLFTGLNSFGEGSGEKERPPSRMNRPKWDIGLALGYFNTPDYPGSDRSSDRYLALPYLYYRGEIIRNDREGLRGKLFNSERMEASVSAGAMFPARSRNNNSRQGMPDIDWTGQIGPQLEIRLNNSPIAKVSLMLPYRFVFSTDFKKIESRGAVFNPEIKLRHRALFDPTMFFSFTVGANFGTESFHDYFFEVPSNYATSTRPAYNAHAGFIGTEVGLSVIKSLTKELTLFTGVKHNYYADNKNRSSPLMRDIENQIYFVGLAWSLFTAGAAPVDNLVSK